jgi:hypothetical protein
MLNVKTLTDTMSRMELPQLQQYAALHKNDPYIVTLALSIANQKKQMKAGQAGQAGMMPQPKVADQQIAQMVAPPQQEAPAVDAMGNVTGYAGGGYLPEDQGIGQLPAPNMQGMAGGGIVAFDDGGQVPGYADGVFTGLKKKYKELQGYEFKGGPEMFDKALDAEGVTDSKKRAFLKAIHDKESNQARVAPTREGSDAAGPMQVRPGAWKDVSKKGEELKDRNDSYDNMRAGIRYASMGWEKAKGDPALASTFYYGGKGGFDKAKNKEGVAAAEDKGQTTLQYGNDVANRMKSFLPKDIIPGTQAQAQTTPAKGITALTSSGDYSDPGTGFSMPQDVFSPSPEEERKYAAAQAQAKKVGDVVNQIPGQSRQAPAYRDENTYFGGVADRAGIPLEAQRNINNAINATSGLTAPVGGVNRAAAGVSKGLEPTAEMIQKAAQAKQIAETPRLLPPAKAGLEVLDETSAAARAAAENARRMRQLEEDRKAATGAQQSVEAATKTASIADKTAREIAVAQDAARLNHAKMTGAAQGVVMTQAADKAGGIPDLTANQPPALTPNDRMGESVFDPTYGGTLPPEAKKDVVDALKEQTGSTTAELKQQAADSGIDWNSFLIRFGLGMMAGESQYASVNAGKAGLGALDAELASQKAKQAQALNVSESELKKMQAKYYGSYADAIERGAKEKNAQLQAETLVQQHIEKWLSSGPGLIATGQDPNATAKEEARVRKSIYQQLGLNPIMSSNTPAGGAKFIGFENPA